MRCDSASASADATVLEDIYLPPSSLSAKRGRKQRDRRDSNRWHNSSCSHAARQSDEGRREICDGGGARRGSCLAKGHATSLLSMLVRTNARDRHCATLLTRTAVISSKVVKSKMEEAGKFRDYFDWQEPLRRCSSHRLLAMRRGEAEGFLRLSIAPADDERRSRLSRHYVKPGTPAATQMQLALADAYKRLLRPSIENEFATSSKQKADDEAILVFAENLKQLLFGGSSGTTPHHGHRPRLPNGCKVVCLDAQGNLLHNETIYPHQPQKPVGDALPAASPRWRTNMPLKPSPSATERRDAKRNSSCAKRILRMSTFSW